MAFDVFPSGIAYIALPSIPLPLLPLLGKPQFMKIYFAPFTIRLAKYILQGKILNGF
jgi:hypothetical protein